MHPFIELGNLKLQLYYPMFFIGFAAALLIVLAICRKYDVRERFGISKKDVFGISLYGGIGLYVVAKFFFFLTRMPEVFSDLNGFKTRFDADLPGTLDFLFGGMVFYGGLIGFLIGMLIYSRQNRIEFFKLADFTAPFIPLVHAIGRVGCFFNGCCYGTEYHGFFAVNYPYSTVEPELSAVPRFPVQLVETGLNVLCFTVLIYMLIISMRKGDKKKIEKDKKSDKAVSGRLLGIYLAYYIIVRFILEFFRADEIRGMIGVLSTSQVISILLIPITVWLLVRKKQQKGRFCD